MCSIYSSNKNKLAAVHFIPFHCIILILSKRASMRALEYSQYSIKFFYAVFFGSFDTSRSETIDPKPLANETFRFKN